MVAQLRDLQREVLRYPRNDGVMLTATLYTPPGYSAERDGPLPCIVWAYPREFKSKVRAQQALLLLLLPCFGGSSCTTPGGRRAFGLRSLVEGHDRLCFAAVIARRLRTAGRVLTLALASPPVRP